ncbi:hypothetical protein DPMN_120996 [Dreissena polymorpha]|uniref:Uncharacterized protein n=1 Tax=Dreissena polymorpha TaxID=45954 RepID=A0A9D4JT73_DREPO|nr:hypothetical protein DPMN_120996 [Dreissena polymorpha]
MNITLESTVIQGGSQRTYRMIDLLVGFHFNKGSTAIGKSTNGLIMNAAITLTGREKSFLALYGSLGSSDITC